MMANVRGIQCLAGIVAALAILVNATTHAATAIVDFEGLPTTPPPTYDDLVSNPNDYVVQGTALDNYLGIYGITLKDVTPTYDPRIGVFVTSDTFSPFGIFDEPDNDNYLDQFFGIHGTVSSYTLEFSQLLSGFSFTRRGIDAEYWNGNIILLQDWSARALDSNGSVLEVLGEPIVQGAFSNPSQQFSFSADGIKAVRFSTPYTGVSERYSVPIDDLILEFVPEPNTTVLLFLGLVGVALQRRRVPLSGLPSSAAEG